MLLPLRAPPVISVIVPMQNDRAYTIVPRVLTARAAARSFCVAPGAREAGSNPALPRNCVGGRRPIMPPLRREGGPEDEPQARRPAGSLTVCLPRGGWPQARFAEARSLDSRVVGFFSVPDSLYRAGSLWTRREFMRFFFSFSEVSCRSLVRLFLSITIAHTQTPASTSSPAQTQTRKASPATQTKSASSKKKTSQSGNAS